MVIPPEQKREISRIVEYFNQDNGCEYQPKYQGKYLYLHRQDGYQLSKICRLEYCGRIDNWRFAIYKASTEKYDPEEDFFAGAVEADGTLEGAMRAGLAAYPIS